MSQQFSRRDFLKLSSGALAAALSPAWMGRSPLGEDLSPITRAESDPAVTHMGRVLAGGISFYDKAERGAKRLGYRGRDEAFIITGEIRAPGLNAHNDLWYETEEGYVFSAWVQPMLIYPPQPTYYGLGEWGAWGEICQPYTSARIAPHPTAA